MYTVQTILLPTDFSKHSEYAFWLASMLARDHGARLIVMHVVQIPLVNYGELGTIDTFEDTRAKARENLDAIQPVGDLKIERRLEQGDPLDQILSVAKDAKADLIVVGTHGRGGLGRLLLGSVAEAVLRKAPCPVVMVKNPLHFAKE